MGHPSSIEQDKFPEPMQLNSQTLLSFKDEGHAASRTVLAGATLHNPLRNFVKTCALSCRLCGEAPNVKACVVVQSVV